MGFGALIHRWSFVLEFLDWGKRGGNNFNLNKSCFITKQSIKYFFKKNILQEIMSKIM